MTLDERHAAAIQRIKNKLFPEGFAPYRIDEKSVEVLPPYQSKLIGSEPSLGGLAFKFLIPGKDYRGEIRHFERALFNFNVVDHNSAQEYVRFSVAVLFKDLPQELARLVELLKAI